jgi:hypothetical protein
MGRSVKRTKKFTTKDGRTVEFVERDPHTLTAEQDARLKRIYAYFVWLDKQIDERIARGEAVYKAPRGGLTK